MVIVNSGTKFKAPCGHLKQLNFDKFPEEAIKEFLFLLVENSRDDVPPKNN